MIRTMEIQIGLNSRNSLVSSGFALILALVPWILNEFSSMALTQSTLIGLSLILLVVGYLFANRFPFWGRVLPFAAVASWACFSLAQGFYDSYERKQIYQRFIEATNSCEGYALSESGYLGSCIKLDSETIKRHCKHLSGNQWNCPLKYTNDVVASTDDFKPIKG